ncbi:MAG: hypothetical protein MZW92_02090 [Comamonadaceae bacterium]|nr:hypothetical protein [Comamonadaceae bacterium]
MRQGKRDLTVIANDTAMPGVGIGKLVRAPAGEEGHRQPHRPEPRDAGADDRRRDGGRAGAAGHADRAHPRRRLRPRRHPHAPPAWARWSRQGKQKVAVAGKDYLVEPALRADFALVNAFMADYLGNLAYVLTARNFNPVIAMAARHRDRRGRQHRAGGPDRAGPRA